MSKKKHVRWNIDLIRRFYESLAYNYTKNLIQEDFYKNGSKCIHESD